MATKTLNTRIKSKIDTLSNWQTASTVLFAGEIGVATIAANAVLPSDLSALTGHLPAIVIKVGDGTKGWNELPYLSAFGADVYDWAKAETKPLYAATEITGLADFISGEINDTNTQYSFSYDNGNNQLVIQKKDVKDTGFVAYQTVDIPIPDLTGYIQKAEGNVVADELTSWTVDGKVKGSGIQSDNVQVHLTGATPGNVAIVGINGAIVDGNKALSDIQTKLTTATANNILTANADGFIQDSGKGIDSVQFKVAGSKVGDIPKFKDTTGELIDSGVLLDSLATQAWVTEQLGGITGVTFQIVASYEELPTTGENGVIYLVPNGKTGNNAYDEYIWVTSDGTGKYEKIGSTEVDLSDYYTKEQADGKFLQQTTFNTTIANYYTKDDSDGRYYTQEYITTNYYTKTQTDTELGKKVNGNATGTTTGNVVAWGSDGYHITDTGFTIAKSVPANANFNDTGVTSVTANNGLTGTISDRDLTIGIDSIDQSLLSQGTSDYLIFNCGTTTTVI
nr:MAG TPA: hyaluronidase [Caudoviricetes sp.]